MQDSRFYGTEKISSISYLEFGAIDLNSSKKLVWDLKLHQKAYDWYMHARYSNDILYYTETGGNLAILTPQDVICKYIEEVHHKDDFSVNIGKLCALAVSRRLAGTNRPVSFFELGQTLFGCIDAMDFCQKFMTWMGIGFDPLNLRAIQWYGVDISNFFNKLSVLMHSGYDLRTFDSMDKLDAPTDVFFAKGVTMLYAIRNIEQLINILNSARICIFDYSFAANKEHDTIIGSGKLVKYLKLSDFAKEINKLPGKIYVKSGNSFPDRQNDRVVVDCLYASEPVCQEFITLDQAVRHELTECLKELPSSATLLDSASGRNSGWMPFEEFMERLS